MPHSGRNLSFLVLSTTGEFNPLRTWSCSCSATECWFKSRNCWHRERCGNFPDAAKVCVLELIECPYLKNYFFEAAITKMCILEIVVWLRNTYINGFCNFVERLDLFVAGNQNHKRRALERLPDTLKANILELILRLEIHNELPIFTENFSSNYESVHSGINCLARE